MVTVPLIEINHYKQKEFLKMKKEQRKNDYPFHITSKHILILMSYI